MGFAGALCMDIVTHALFGALAAGTAARNTPARVSSAWAGGVSACLPDLDVFIRSAEDPLLVLEYHRHFTHSLFFSPLCAAVGMLLLGPFFRRRFSPPALYVACLIGYTSACLLDVCTSYGTHVFWPIYSRPIALGIIAVVDPLFTLLVALGLFFCLRLEAFRLRWLGMAAAGFYLCLGVVQLHRAERAALTWAENNPGGRDPAAASRILVKPTLGNLLLWRALIVRDGQVQALGLRVGLSGRIVHYLGEKTALVDHREWRSRLADSRAYEDLQRFSRFADGLLVVVPGETHQIGDVRYAMLPTSVEPLWGIELDEHNPRSAPRFFTRRNASAEIRAAFLGMLAGEATAIKK